VDPVKDIPYFHQPKSYSSSKLWTKLKLTMPRILVNCNSLFVVLGTVCSFIDKIEGVDKMGALFSEDSEWQGF
jgi:hypothetical protein